MVRLELGEADLGELADVVGLTVEAREHEQDGSAEVRGDPCVERQLGGARDVGVVGAQDEDGVAGDRDVVELRDDLRERALGVVVDLVVRHADALLVAEIHAVAREQELEHVVAAGAGVRLGAARHRPEHPHPPETPLEEFQHAQRDGRLAGLPLRGGDVHASAGLAHGSLSLWLGASSTLRPFHRIRTCGAAPRATA